MTPEQLAAAYESARTAAIAAAIAEADAIATADLAYATLVALSAKAKELP